MAKNDFDKLFDGVKKMNKHASVLSENTISNVTGWLDTGCYALNAISSGSLFGGLPKGRTSIFEGDSGTGKTLILNKTLGRAQKAGMEIYIFDTENAIDSASTKGVGLDPAKVRYVPIHTIEDMAIQVVNLLTKLEENEAFHGKVVIGIDSLGGLVSKKELNDAANEKVAMDMGLRAKLFKAAIKMINGKCALSNTTVIFTNHVYNDPSQLFPSLIQKTPGGKGAEYLPSVRIQMGARREKTDTKNTKDVAVAESKNVSGLTLRMITSKNRFIIPFLATEVYLNFKTGLDPFSGLFEMAENHGLLEREGGTGHTYLFNGEKIGFKKNFRHDAKLWEEKIIPALEEKIKTAYRFGNDLDAPAAKLDD